MLCTDIGTGVSPAAAVAADLAGVSADTSGHRGKVLDREGVATAAAVVCGVGAGDFAFPWALAA